MVTLGWMESQDFLGRVSWGMIDVNWVLISDYCECMENSGIISIAENGGIINIVESDTYNLNICVLL